MKDFLDQTLEVGDEVIYTNYERGSLLFKAKVLDLSESFVLLENHKGNKVRKMSSSHIIKVCACK